MATALGAIQRGWLEVGNFILQLNPTTGPSRQVSEVRVNIE